jgi:ankyrin repeat protein
MKLMLFSSFSTAFSGESPDEDVLDDAGEAPSNPLHLAAAKVGSSSSPHPPCSHGPSCFPFSFFFFSSSLLDTQGDLAAVRALVAEHGLDQLDNFGRTPLMFAVIANRGKVCRFLLKSGANVNARDDNGNSALLWAACRGCRDAARVLLADGADIEAADLAGRSALHWACKLKRPDVLEMLLKSSFLALTNRRDDEGLTPLHWAVMCDHTAHVELLLSHQGNATVGDLQGRTCLHYAVTRSAVACLQLILQRCPQVT